THSGRYSKPAGKAEPIIPVRDPYRDPLSPEPAPNALRPSQIPDDWPRVTDEYLDALQDKYVEAARLAFEAGFDAVDIKSCHGYLINELLAAHTRKGKYGGSFENRTRFLLGVIDRIREELGDVPITLRLGVFDCIPYPYGWGVDQKDYTKPDLSEPKKLLKLLHQRGVRMANVTVANPYYNPHVNRPFNVPIQGGYKEPEHPLIGVHRLIGLTGQLQQAFKDIAFVGSGYSWLRHLMGSVAAVYKAKEWVTIVGGGRMGFAYPDFPKDLIRTGKMDPHKVCIGCSACTQIMRDGGSTGCVVRDNKTYGPIFRKGRMRDIENLKRLAQACLECEDATCKRACPAGVDIPKFIHAFLEGDEKQAYEIIRRVNILPEICAWLCPVEQQCQGGCLQGFIGDSPLPIAEIQRHIAEQANRYGWSRLRLPEETSGRNVAVIGAGPAGLAATAVLVEAGHRVTLYDKSTQFGGMIQSVIPPARQCDALRSEISAIFRDIPEDRLVFQWGTPLTEQFTLDSILQEGFDAAFIGIGLPKAVSHGGDKLDGLYNALEFLEVAKTEPGRLQVRGKKVAVIGGGNTAMDVAITARDLKAKDVYIVYRRSFEEMPAWEAERQRAMEEGVHFLILTQQLGYESKDGKLTGIRVCPVQLGPEDASGRRRPMPLEAAAYPLGMEVVIESIGQQAIDNLEQVLPGVGIRDGLILLKEGTHETTRNNVFAGGDLVHGASTVVAAVADGMAAGREIDDRLTARVKV
ncbi:MAG: FAD-dependent oxidoreductase, partial [Sedimentisphaerales bacterium]|nr:FAD-dependent oxidoreductase [Sedimentisphaerales bacterium]